MNTWMKLTIKHKIITFTLLVFLLIFVSMGLSVWMIKFSLFDFSQFLGHNSITNELVIAMKQESDSFKTYMNNQKSENREELEQAMNQTKQAVDALPMRYEVIGMERFAKTQALLRAYHVYEIARDDMLQSKEESRQYIRKLYEVYDMQHYLQEYAESLMELTIRAGNLQYIKKVPILKVLPGIVVLISIIIIGGMCYLSFTMNKTIIHPILKLADSAKKIAENDFYIDDVVVENMDEIGDLVHAFNKMKYATGEYISALEDQRETRELLFEKELEKLEMQKQLDSIHLELLKSQIQPHFLFNTLNVIAGMANLEDAHTTEKMTKALSNLFRYNLKTPDVYVVLSKEIKVLEDYMYLQQMRFGSRVAYELFCEVEADEVLIPSFIFQPLAENAIIHGIGPKEEGGKIMIHIWKYSKSLYITFNDTGVGMDEERLQEIIDSLNHGKDKEMGIGLQNVYCRIKSLYEDMSFEIFSRKDEGTLIKIRIPFQKEIEDEHTDC